MLLRDRLARLMFGRLIPFNDGGEPLSLQNYEQIRRTMATNDPTTANIAIAEALGLDPTRIRKGGVTIALTDIGPVVTVEYQTYDQDLTTLLTGLKRYKLVPKDYIED